MAARSASAWRLRIRSGSTRLSFKTRSRITKDLGELWIPRRAFWADRAAHESAFRANFLSLATTRARHAGDDPNPEPYDPDLWTDELAFLSQPGQADIQTELFYDYRTNVDAYPKWQAWMREKKPRLLVIWGKHDLSFDLGEPERYRKDVPDAQIHVLDASHFALDTKADEIAALVRDFMEAQKDSGASLTAEACEMQSKVEIAIKLRFDRDDGARTSCSMA